MTQFIRFPIQIITSGIIEFMNKSHFRVYACLDSHKDGKSWQAFPSLETVKREIKMNRQIIQSALKDLVEWGLIKKALIRRKKGGGYRAVYTIIKEPTIKKPLKRVREKIWGKGKQKRDKKGKFTGSHKPHKRSGAEHQHKPGNMADFRHNKNHKPGNMAAAIKPGNMAAHKSVNMANIQSSLSSVYPVIKKEETQTHSPKGKDLKKQRPKIDASEKGWKEAFSIPGEKTKDKEETMLGKGSK